MTDKHTGSEDSMANSPTTGAGAGADVLGLTQKLCTLCTAWQHRLPALHWLSEKHAGKVLAYHC